jgi:hypothetical protein
MGRRDLTSEFACSLVPRKQPLTLLSSANVLWQVGQVMDDHLGCGWHLAFTPTYSSNTVRPDCSDFVWKSQTKELQAAPPPELSNSTAPIVSRWLTSSVYEKQKRF